MPKILRQTSYYSLIGGYKDIFKNPTTKKYKDGTRFEDIVDIVENEEEDRVSEVICKYDLQGNLIEQYETVAVASMQSKVKEYMIRRACSGNRNSAGGFKWKYQD